MPMRETDVFQETLFNVRKLDDFVPERHPLAAGAQSVKDFRALPPQADSDPELQRAIEL